MFEVVKKKRRAIKSFLKPMWAIGVLIIVILSVMPSTQLPVVDMSDKLEHFLAYFFISVLGMFAASTNSHRLALMVAMVFLGLGLEVVQYMLPTRHFELLDGVANALGVLAAFGLYHFYKKAMKN